MGDQDFNKGFASGVGAGMGSGIDWESLGQFLGQFGDVRTHLMRSGSEFILALKSLIDQILKSLETEYPNARQKWEFLYALQYTLGFLGGRLSADSKDEAKDDQAKEKRAKIAALESILSVIDHEIEAVLDPYDGDESKCSETDKIRLGAMMAIRNVLVREIERTRGRPRAPKKKTEKPTVDSTPA